MNPLLEAALMLAPGIVCLCLAAAVHLRPSDAGLRAANPERLSDVGIALLALVPGLRFILDVAAGPSAWPVIVAAIAEIGLGIALLDVVRRGWRRASAEHRAESATIASRFAGVGPSGDAQMRQRE